VAVLALDTLARAVADGRQGETDRLVRGIAERLARAVGERDRLGRWSDAELVALLPGTSPSDARRRLDEAWQAFVRERVWDPGPEGEPSFPVGVSAADAGADLREVVAAALFSVGDRRPAGAVGPDEVPRAGTAGRILLVEADRVTATLIHHRLAREGFDVMDFLNGEDAYRWASSGDFDVGIVDLKVPGMDGFELLRRFRTMPHLAATPIVMLTSLGKEADVVRGLELGATDYMLKPFSPTELLARVRRLTFPRASGSFSSKSRGV
jgi:PleD family two-component response regulator